MMTGMVCYNAQTGEYHFEKDSAYTFVGIPFGTDDINAMCLFVFEFGWGEVNSLMSNSIKVQSCIILDILLCIGRYPPLRIVTVLMIQNFGICQLMETNVSIKML